MPNPLLSSQQPPTGGSLQVPSQSLHQQMARTPTPTPTYSSGNPVHLLASRGVTDKNTTNISVLASAMESFGEFRRPGNNAYAIGKEGALQPIATMKLLCEVATLHGNNRPISQNEFSTVVQDLKTTLFSCLHPGLHTRSPMYAAIAK